MAAATQHTTVSERRSSRRERRLLLAGAVALLVGLAVSGAAALVWRSTEQSRERQAFASAASNVTATLGTLLRRDADFVATLRAVLTTQPRLTATGFNIWYEALSGKQRQIGSIGSAVVSLVPSSRLRAFETRRDADPAIRSLMGTWLTPVPRGDQPRYCLFSAGGALVPINSLTAGLVQQDWCQANSEVGMLEAPLLANAADSGKFLAMSVNVPWLHTMFLEAAYYRRDAQLTTIAQRRAAVSGWVVSSFDIPAVIRAALGRNRRLSVNLYHTNPGEPATLVGSVGPTRRSGELRQNTTMSIDGTWTIAVHGPQPVVAISAAVQTALVFAAGAVITILVLLLARSRRRALELVVEKTGRLRHQALHDALTGLPNRVLAVDRAEQTLARARRAQVAAAALYVDIDSFKHVNDTFGHAAGDELLEIVAGRLRGVIRESDTAARLAGDEFVLLLDSSQHDASPELVAERVLEVLREPYELNGKVGRTLSLTASIGIAYGMNSTAEELLADADVALYVAKSSGKNRYVVFQSGMATANQDRLMLELDLADALAEDQLFLLYQPTFDLESEQPIGVEALLRWRHPERGVIGPDMFIPIAEQSGLIVPIGGWVLQHACHQASIWRVQGHKIGISVNVSARQLDSDELIDHVQQALNNSELEPSALTLEITETTLMRDTDATAKRLAALKDLGVRIAIDDFGTGYSSLAYLRQFTVDALKIDRSFINGISTSHESTALIHTLVRLGKTLNIETLAEGIENHAQLHALQLQHCDHGQGFLFARPLAAQDIEQFLIGWRANSTTTHTVDQDATASPG